MPLSNIEFDELSSYGAKKQGRLPALIKINNQTNDSKASSEEQQARSMPEFNAKLSELNKPEISLQNPNISSPGKQENSTKDKENEPTEEKCDTSFQLVDMDCGNENSVVGPSLPPPKESGSAKQQPISAVSLEPDSMHLGESLIDMIINLRNENQRLLHALETNNDYVKSRIDEFKRASDEAQKRAVQHATEKAELEHQLRKLKRQNSVMSESLKSMEAKLRDMKLGVEESMMAGNFSSRASSGQQVDYADDGHLYPNLADLNPFDAESQHATLQREGETLQMDVANEEMRHDLQPSAPLLDEEPQDETPNNSHRHEAKEDNLDYSQMTREQLNKHFDANKTAFYAIDDPMKQCDKLEQQLNELGRRDYEICLLQQQLNVYRQDFRLERMAELEARIQIEKLKSEIDRICLDRLYQKCAKPEHSQHQHKSHQNVRFSAGTSGLVGKMGRKAAKSAAKAAKYAAKQAHLEEKAAAAAAALAARYNSRQEQHSSASSKDARESGFTQTYPAEHQQDKHGHTRTSSNHHRTHKSGKRSEVVNDLWETANKAMLTGYKMASTHVNLALDKLNEYEQSQADQLAKKKQPNEIK